VEITIAPAPKKKTASSKQAAAKSAKKPAAKPAAKKAAPAKKSAVAKKAAPKKPVAKKAVSKNTTPAKVVKAGQAAKAKAKEVAKPARKATNPKLSAVAQQAKLIAKILDDNKAEEIVTIDLASKCSFADFMIVASGRSQRHVSALADHVGDALKKAGTPPMNIEGKDSSDWVLIDAGDVIVHLFRPEVRQFYNIEKMWALAPVEA
jgi:ribosome-associated protein